MNKLAYFKGYMEKEALGGYRQPSLLPSFMRAKGFDDAPALPEAYKTKKYKFDPEVHERVKQVIRNQTGIDKIKRGHSFYHDLGMDDLDAVETIMGVEDEFGRDISDDQAEKMLTVGDISEYLSKKANVVTEIPVKKIWTGIQNARMLKGVKDTIGNKIDFNGIKKFLLSNPQRRYKGM